MLRTRIVAGPTSGFVLGAVFATVLTVTHFGEAFVEPWRVHPGAPAPVTLRLPRTSLQTRDVSDGTLQVKTFTAVVPRGSVVRQEPLASLINLHERGRRPPRPTRLAAQWLVYFLFIVMAAAYMRQASSERGGLLRVQVSLLGLALLLLVLGKVGLLLTDLPAYLLPVAAVPLWASLYVDRRTGLMLSLVSTVCASSLVAYDPVVTAVYLMSTTIATLAFRGRRRASTMIPAGLAGGLVAGIVYVAAREIYDGFELADEMAAPLRSGPVSAVFGGLAAGLLGLLLHAPVSRLFGIVSRGELLNLSDLEQPLLQKMANDAPGSWEHSRMMANLAEAAAASIHADALLTRVGAYYHDLGKSVQPQYFVENLQPGETSPHDGLDPDVSADAIMAHVVEGVRILREGGIPEAVIEFAYTHHGTSVIEFFWHKCKKSGNPKGLAEDAFRYPGMRPRSKETGILMLIDAIEAGARTVTPPSREKFDELVRRVIFSKLKQGQLDESGLSLEELRVVTSRIVDTLCNAYHSRIKYPWQEKAEQESAVAKAAARDTDRDLERDSDDDPERSTETGKHAAMRRSEAKKERERDRATETGKQATIKRADRSDKERDRATETGKQVTAKRANRSDKERDRATETGKQVTAKRAEPKPDRPTPDNGPPRAADRGVPPDDSKPLTSDSEDVRGAEASEARPRRSENGDPERERARRDPSDTYPTLEAEPGTRKSKSDPPKSGVAEPPAIQKLETTESVRAATPVRTRGPDAANGRGRAEDASSAAGETPAEAPRSASGETH